MQSKSKDKRGKSDQCKLNNQHDLAVLYLFTLIELFGVLKLLFVSTTLTETLYISLRKLCFAIRFSLRHTHRLSL
jgi:hypothetical protein